MTLCVFCTYTVGLFNIKLKFKAKQKGWWNSRASFQFGSVELKAVTCNFADYGILNNIKVTNCQYRKCIPTASKFNSSSKAISQWRSLLNVYWAKEVARYFYKQKNMVWISWVENGTFARDYPKPVSKYPGCRRTDKRHRHWKKVPPRKAKLIYRFGWFFVFVGAIMQEFSRWEGYHEAGNRTVEI